MTRLIVNLSPKSAAEIITDYVLKNGVSTQCVGTYSNRSSDQNEVIMLVFEKFFMRNSSRASLSVIIENIGGRTVVGSVGSGGGQGAIFNFDWGAGDSFSNLVNKALNRYLV